MKETIQKIIKFISPIPEEQWCINERLNYDDQRCVLGHMEKKEEFNKITKYPGEPRIARDLARANNGIEDIGGFQFGKEATKFDRFKSPKTRSIKFLESLLVNDGWKRYL